MGRNAVALVVSVIVQYCFFYTAEKEIMGGKRRPVRLHPWTPLANGKASTGYRKIDQKLPAKRRAVST